MVGHLTIIMVKMIN